jgi:hypothetical protein
LFRFYLSTKEDISASGDSISISVGLISYSLLSSIRGEAFSGEDIESEMIDCDLSDTVTSLKSSFF